MKNLQYILALYAGTASALTLRGYWPGQQSCKPVSGTFEIEQERLFPESADWDPVHCKLYAGALYNASAIQYDPYTKEIKKLTFPGITGDPLSHVGGVDYDASTGSILFAANAGAAFDTQGKNLTGPNYLIKYDTNSDAISWYANMSIFQEEVMAESGHLVGGFQDMAEDPRGNVYMIASYGDAIARVSPDGKDIGVFYNSKAQNTSILGIGALFTYGDLLVVAQSRIYGFLVFNTTAPDHAVPVAVQPDTRPSDSALEGYWCDSLVAPSEYNGTVAMCAIDKLNGVGGVAVFESKDGWQSVSYKGYVERQNNLTVNAVPTATVAIGDSFFIVEEFPDGPKSSFPFLDITTAVEKLLS